MHGLHDKFYFDGKKNIHAASALYLFLEYLSTINCYGKALTIVTKFSIFDVAGVLNPCQYELTWIVYRNNYIQVLMNRNKWLT